VSFRKNGISLAIDDFGVGYSSLSYLMNFPVDRLKIDRSFISRVTGDPNAAAIARTVIALTKNLKLGIVAEGIETEVQLEFCRREGCDEVQGFYFSPALSADRLKEWYRRRSPAKAARRLVTVPR